MSPAARMRIFATDRNGIAAVEFALVAPLLILLALGTIVTGQYLAVAHSVQQIANEAARYSVAAGASLGGRQAMVDAFVAAHAAGNPLVEPDLLLAVVTDAGDGFHRVTVSYGTDRLLVRLFPNIVRFDATAIDRVAVVRAGGL